ncbi:hypothetical protein PR048_015355 [Dryococelus australis]|uniref:Uncharacterized protein n=1 Tax=Dryococelus australis TaxID=614101 RepID=A0ABQ9HGQ5_9NEOP|nr:hypothetical protein PR048_015355 [Dryococelus australis]
MWHLGTMCATLTGCAPPWRDVCHLGGMCTSLLHDSFSFANNKTASNNGPRWLSGQPSLLVVSPDFRSWESCRTITLVGGFSRGSTFPPPLRSGAAPYSPQSPPSALKISLRHPKVSWWENTLCSLLFCECGPVVKHYRLFKVSGEESISGFRNDAVNFVVDKRWWGSPSQGQLQCNGKQVAEGRDCKRRHPCQELITAGSRSEACGRAPRLVDSRGRGGIVVRLFACHKGRSDSISDEVTPGFSHVGIVPDAVIGRRVLSGISSFPHSFLPTLLHLPLTSPLSAIKTSMLRADQISPLTLILSLCRHGECTRVHSRTSQTSNRNNYLTHLPLRLLTKHRANYLVLYNIHIKLLSASQLVRGGRDLRGMWCGRRGDRYCS